MVLITQPTVRGRCSRNVGTSLSLDTLMDSNTEPHTIHKRSLWLRFVAFPYYGPLHYYTIDPMSKICDKQDDLTTTIKLLCLFKSRKHEEITFIRVASALSAAASIGTLSWPDLITSLWAAKYFLVISLYMSAFALVSTAALRQLDYFPNTTTAIFSEREVHAMLGLLLNFPKSLQIPETPQISQRKDSQASEDCEALPDQIHPARGKPSLYKQYFWQTSMMLMSGSWLTYLLGVTLYVVTPLTVKGPWTIAGVASAITFSLAMLISANFLITNNRAFTLLDIAKRRGLKEENELESRDNAW